MTTPASHIYIAGPMSGYPDLNKRNFSIVEQQLRKLGWITFNPVESEVTIRTKDMPPRQQYRECMKVDLLWICAHAHAIYMLKGWEHSKGATAEHALAKCLGLKIFYQNDLSFPLMGPKPEDYNLVG